MSSDEESFEQQDSEQESFKQQGSDQQSFENQGSEGEEQMQQQNDREKLSGQNEDNEQYQSFEQDKSQDFKSDQNGEEAEENQKQQQQDQNEDSQEQQISEELNEDQNGKPAAKESAKVVQKQKIKIDNPKKQLLVSANNKKGAQLQPSQTDKKPSQREKEKKMLKEKLEKKIAQLREELNVALMLRDGEKIAQLNAQIEKERDKIEGGHQDQKTEKHTKKQALENKLALRKSEKAKILCHKQELELLKEQQKQLLEREVKAAKLLKEVQTDQDKAASRRKDKSMAADELSKRLKAQFAESEKQRREEERERKLYAEKQREALIKAEKEAERKQKIKLYKLKKKHRQIQLQEKTMREYEKKMEVKRRWQALKYLASMKVQHQLEEKDEDREYWRLYRKQIGFQQGLQETQNRAEWTFFRHALQIRELGLKIDERERKREQAYLLMKRHEAHSLQRHQEEVSKRQFLLGIKKEIERQQILQQADHRTQVLQQKMRQYEYKRDRELAMTRSKKQEKQQYLEYRNQVFAQTHNQILSQSFNNQKVLENWKQRENKFLKKQVAVQTRQRSEVRQTRHITNLTEVQKMREEWLAKTLTRIYKKGFVKRPASATQRKTETVQNPFSQASVESLKAMSVQEEGATVKWPFHINLIEIHENQSQ